MIRWLQKADGTRVLQFWNTTPVMTCVPEWQNVSTEVEKPCDHAWDGLVYTTYPPQSKCRLCGKFYRVNAVPKPEPRKPREWWVNPDNRVAYEGAEKPEGTYMKWVKVREVLPDDK